MNTFLRYNIVNKQRRRDAMRKVEEMAAKKVTEKERNFPRGRSRLAQAK